jgi:hypothetical protein
MGAQHDDTTATTSLRLLNRYFRERPTTSAEGHSYIGSAPRATATAPGLPYNATVTDLIDSSVAEVADHTRAVNPDAGPLPARLEAVYDWYREHTAHADEDQRRRGEAIVYRQQLEHAIAMGAFEVVRPHRCPACATFSLMWRQERQRALCTNQRCLGRDGMSRTWTLARLAYEHVAVEKTSRECAT